MKEEIQVLKQTELLGQQFKVYGTLEEPLFRATDVARLINHSDVSTMMRNVDDDEKGTKIVCTPGGNQQVWMLTENSNRFLFAQKFANQKSCCIFAPAKEMVVIYFARASG